MKWFRLYVDVIHDPKVQKLQPQLFKDWINVLCLAAEHDGKIPASMPDIAFTLHVTEARVRKIIDDLTRAGLLDVSETAISPHNWNSRQYKSDVSTERVRRYRNGKGNASRNVTGNVSETPSDTDTETDTDTEPDGGGKTRRGRAPVRRNRNAEMLTNVAGLMEQYFDGKRPAPDLLIATRVHDALGYPCTWERIVAFRDFLAIKRASAFLPESYGIFLSWAEMVCRQCDALDGGEDAASGV